MQAYRCRHGSAWHAWQSLGFTWKLENPTATKSEATQAAIDFGNAAGPGWPKAAYDARRRAFAEGANHS